MKSVAIFVSILACVSAFGIVHPRAASPILLFAAVPEEQMTSNQKEIKVIQEKWHTVRFLSSEEAAKLEPEWKEAYDRFNEKYDEDMSKMLEISQKLKKMIEPPRVQKKTEGQRRRDKWAIVQAREAARASARAAAVKKVT
ncbi:hypothetical protein ACA910_000202 [Epithemia clementina (nom. ined.)]